MVVVNLSRVALHGAVAENSYLVGEGAEAGPMDQLLGFSITVRMAVGPRAIYKVFILQMPLACDEPFTDQVGEVAGFPMHAGVASKIHERAKLERLCRNISLPAISEKRLSLTPNASSDGQ